LPQKVSEQKGGRAILRQKCQCGKKKRNSRGRSGAGVHHLIAAYRTFPPAGPHWTALGLTLDGTDFTDSEAIAAIVRITGGNFRLWHRLFAQIGRLLTLNGLHTRTKEVVEAARECLIIGMT
jgi:hypothetical protein